MAWEDGFPRDYGYFCCHSWGQMSSPMFAQSQLPTAGKRRGAETPGGQASEATADPYDPSGHMKPQKHGL